MQSTWDFFTSKHTLKFAADMSMSVIGRDAARKDKSGTMTGPCIIAAMVATNLLGIPTSWIEAHAFWHTLSKDQVRALMRFHRRTNPASECAARRVVDNTPWQDDTFLPQRTTLVEKVRHGNAAVRCTAKTLLIGRLHTLVSDPKIIKPGADKKT